MLSCRTSSTGSLILSLVICAGCGSESGNEQQFPPAAGGSLGSGGSLAAGGQGAPGSGGFGVAAGGQAMIGSGGTEVAAGGQAVIGSGGSVIGDGGSFPMGGGGMSSAGTTGAGGASDGGASGAAGAETGGAPGAGGAGGQMLPPITDYAQSGPFTPTMQTNTGPRGGYAIFRPDPLGVDGFVHSPIIFGPGILTTPTSYSSLLNHLASHGFVTIVVNSLSGGPGAQANLDAMRTGLDWLIAQNGEPGVFEGKLAVDRAVTMGYSLGATASVQLSSHAAIITTVSIHGHGTSGDPHGPVLLLTGTSDVIASVRQTHSTLEEAPAVLMALPIGHLNVLTELAMTSSISANTRYIAPITAWLRYWVNGDENAKRYFWGPNCGMCSTPWITPETNALWDAQML